MALTTADVPTRTESAPIVGESSFHTLDDLKRQREATVAARLARLVLSEYFPDKHWLFPRLNAIAKEWMDGRLYCKDNTFPQMLLLVELAHVAADRIYRAIVRGDGGQARLRAVFKPYDTVGSTRYVDFDTTRPVYATDAAKCHINYVVADTNTWEQKMAEALEGMEEVVHYVKNHGLNFTIPYTFEGASGNYIPDFIVRFNDGREDLLNLIVEVSGNPDPKKPAKTATARDLWLPGVNNDGRFGRWDFIEISDPWDAQNTIRAHVNNRNRVFP